MYACAWAVKAGAAVVTSAPAEVSWGSDDNTCKQKGIVSLKRQWCPSSALSHSVWRDGLRSLSDHSGPKNPEECPRECP